MLKYIGFWILVMFCECMLKAQAKGPSHGKAVVCYVASWSAYRDGSGAFDVGQINPSLCTHIVYVFAGLDPATNTVKHIDRWLDVDRKGGAYNRLEALKKRHPHLKIIVAVGGWNDGSVNYSKMASSEQTRQIFIRSVLAYLKQYKFDGLDLHWKYPAMRGGAPEDKTNYVELVKELKESLSKEGYILTAALGCSKSTMEAGYDFSRVSEYLDLMHMMCYDYHGYWEGTIGANAPLRGMSDEDVNSLVTEM